MPEANDIFPAGSDRRAPRALLRMASKARYADRSGMRAVIPRRSKNTKQRWEFRGRA